MVERTSMPLLLTKITVPPQRTQVVPRERLLQRMPADDAARLVVLSAPAGAGKTTFLAHWCHTLLTDGDTDRSAFLDSIAAQWSNLDPDRYPFLNKAATHLREHDDREQFLAGVDIFLAGIAALRQPAPAPATGGDRR